MSCLSSGARSRRRPRLMGVFEPCHLNYDLLGNLVPHVHAHIVPSYLDDPCPNTPLKPWMLHAVADEDLRYQTDKLRGCSTPLNDGFSGLIWRGASLLDYARASLILTID